MLLHKIQKTLDTYRMLDQGDRILVAVSGGPDSVTLCHILHRLRHRHRIELAIAHVHHGLRGVEADEDARFVQDFGRGLGLPVILHHLDVRSWQQRHGGSLQMAARTLRYKYLYEVMARQGARRLALGHNADDQAEEVLLRLFRGAGQRGLTGIPTCTRGGLIRPLLECHRHEIITYLRDHGLDYRQDASNLKPWCQRNRLRLELLPLLERHYNSNLNATLVRTTKIFKEEEDYWEFLLQEWFDRHVSVLDDGGLRLPIDPLLRSHPAMQRRLLRKAVEKVSGDLKGFGFHHTELLMRLCRPAAANRALHLPGMLLAEKSYGRLTIAARHESPAGFCYEIPGPGVHPLPLLNHTMEVQLLDCRGDPRFSRDPTEVSMDRDCISFPLSLRTTRPGDRFRPLGLGGSKKIKDFFMDIKVPRSRRRRIPILFSKGNVVWVVGFRLDDRVKVTDDTTRIVRLWYREDEE